MLAQNWGPGAASERASWEHVLVAPVVDSHPPYRWVLLGGVCAIYFTFGVLVMSIPPLVGEVRADLGLSRSGMGLALGAWQLIYIASSPFCGTHLEN